MSDRFEERLETPPEEYEGVEYAELRMVELLFLEDDLEWRLKVFLPEYGEVKWKWFRRHKDATQDVWKPIYFEDVPKEIQRVFWSKMRKRLKKYRKYHLNAAIRYAAHYEKEATEGDDA